MLLQDSSFSCIQLYGCLLWNILYYCVPLGRNVLDGVAVEDLKCKNLGSCLPVMLCDLKLPEYWDNSTCDSNHLTTSSTVQLYTDGDDISIGGGGVVVVGDVVFETE